MANYRQIHTKIWKDEFFGELSPQHKLLFIYLFSNELSSVSGLYKIPLRVIAFETGLPPEEIMSGLALFEQTGKIFYRDGTVWVKNLNRYNASTSPKLAARISADLNDVSDCELKRAYLNRGAPESPIPYQQPQIPYQQPQQPQIPYPEPQIPYSQSAPEQEQEQEQNRTVAVVEQEQSAQKPRETTTTTTDAAQKPKRDADWHNAKEKAWAAWRDARGPMALSGMDVQEFDALCEEYDPTWVDHAIHDANASKQTSLITWNFVRAILARYQRTGGSEPWTVPRGTLTSAEKKAEEIEQARRDLAEGIATGILTREQADTRMKEKYARGL